jgi:hypothetical protein
MTSLSEAVADSPAEPTLFAGLIDDAAVFPPGNAPLPEAVRGHRAHRASPYAGLIGPLLVPASRAAELAGLVAPTEEPLRVGLVARPGTALVTVTDAAHLLRDHPAIEVAGVEMGWSPEWRDLDFGDTPLTLEVPRGTDQVTAIADIAREAGDDGLLQAKFRTGATPQWAWPDEDELARFIRTAIDHDLGFKLTGGLHHAVRGTHTVHGHQEEQHGLLNVLCAVRSALNGEDVDDLGSLLEERDPGPLVPIVTRMSDADAALVRAFFTAYGCCGVTDPVGELVELHVVELHLIEEH